MSAPAHFMEVKSGERKLDFAETASIDKVALNNKVIQMRPVVKRAKLYVINDLTRKIQKLKSKKGSASQKGKNEAKADRLLDELRALQTLQPDYVSKFALGTTIKFADIVAKPSSPMELRALARLSGQKFIASLVSEFRAGHADWEQLAAYLMTKHTSREFRKKKTRDKISKVEKKVKASETLIQTYLGGKLTGEELGEGNTTTITPQTEHLGHDNRNSVEVNIRNTPHLDNSSDSSEHTNNKYDDYEDDDGEQLDEDDDDDKCSEESEESSEDEAEVKEHTPPKDKKRGASKQMIAKSKSTITERNDDDDETDDDGSDRGLGEALRHLKEIKKSHTSVKNAELTMTSSLTDINSKLRTIEKMSRSNELKAEPKYISNTDNNDFESGDDNEEDEEEDEDIADNSCKKFETSHDSSTKPPYMNNGAKKSKDKHSLAEKVKQKSFKAKEKVQGEMIVKKFPLNENKPDGELEAGEKMVSNFFLDKNSSRKLKKHKLKDAFFDCSDTEGDDQSNAEEVVGESDADSEPPADMDVGNPGDGESSSQLGMNRFTTTFVGSLSSEKMMESTGKEFRTNQEWKRVRQDRKAEKMGFSDRGGRGRFEGWRGGGQFPVRGRRVLDQDRGTRYNASNKAPSYRETQFNPTSSGRVNSNHMESGRGRGQPRDQDQGGPTGNVHPSWEASKKRKQQMGQIQAFAGKKIKFDD